MDLSTWQNTTDGTTNVAKCHGQAWQNATHNKQPQKTSITSSLRSEESATADDPELSKAGQTGQSVLSTVPGLVGAVSAWLYLTHKQAYKATNGSQMGLWCHKVLNRLYCGFLRVF
ncbi:hypothetical protein CSQ89_08405 [Chitinimonas sp. BJB300]|nr:hypothetical protein CSQ89_08405 [Chitinimonas sp. BJB300]